MPNGPRQAPAVPVVGPDVTAILVAPPPPEMVYAAEASAESVQVAFVAYALMVCEALTEIAVE